MNSRSAAAESAVEDCEADPAPPRVEASPPPDDPPPDDPLRDDAALDDPPAVDADRESEAADRAIEA